MDVCAWKKGGKREKEKKKEREKETKVEKQAPVVSTIVIKI